ncbi:transcriptional regulator, MarR family [Oceaniovalibus guishaninsula JLT2003]|uniref:Transcriptional regulator, MarR family n=1 Tax=Oceaniovalibus guishaninsula JLT2003 TaxID=1231392 RepID=K2GJT7_9RHOB|nr:MarR family transcriptional regulator [Oceaniovalibus guishaninsula]EKE43056.1 transcriptional regulator, MarR family [Oceaniovalibus guishaninsula JLT2003]
MPADFRLETFLPYLLNRAAEKASLDFARAYRDRYGMLRTEWRVLVHLGRFGDMTASQIGARAGIHKTKISRAVAALEQRRFLRRLNVEDDRRRAMLSLTPAGRDAHDDLTRAAAAHDAAMTEGFTAAELDTLRDCLRRIAGL